MYREHSVGVVVPAYNESSFIGDVLQSLPEYVDRVYVINDCSTDDTWDEIVHAATADSNDRKNSDVSVFPVTDASAVCGNRVAESREIGRVFAVKHRDNRGPGGAIKTGYFLADHEGVDITVTVDGDGQMDLDHLPRLLDPIVEGTAAYAKGNRLSSKSVRRDMPRVRLFGNLVLSSLTRLVSGYWHVSDSQNGYTAISSEALGRIDIDSLYEYYGYCNELLVKLNVAGVRVVDVPMPAVYGDERSGITYRTYIPRVSWMLARNFGWRVRTKYRGSQFHPLVVCYVLGLFLVGLGILGGIAGAATRVAGTESSLLGSGASIAQFAIVGFLLFSLGVLSERRQLAAAGE